MKIQTTARRIAAFILAFALSFGLFPNAFAAEDADYPRLLSASVEDSLPPSDESPDNTDAPPEEVGTITVYFTLIGDSVHSTPEAHTSFETWISHSAYTIPAGSTVKYLTDMVLNTNNIPFTTDEAGTYIKSINGLSETANGMFSGWMYKLNGSLDNVDGYNVQTLKDGDSVLWQYTDDFMQEFATPETFTGSSGFFDDYYSPSNTTSLSVTDVISSAAEFLTRKVTSPAVSSVGGEWTVLALARANAQVPDNFYSKYIENLETTLQEKNGVLHKTKYTEYARTVLALTAIGKDASELAERLLQTDAVCAQGVNGAAFALLALDSADYAGDSAREEYISYILNNQLKNGGFSLGGGAADPDVTAMVLQALSKYRDRSDVLSAIDTAISALEKLQSSSGGFVSWSTNSCESICQAIVALNELGIGADDLRFVKNRKTLLDKLLEFRCSDGGFSHEKGSPSNIMATEQALYALASIYRFENKMPTLYDMSDADKIITHQASGLSGKHPDVKLPALISEEKSFSDIQTLIAREDILSLARYGIVNGKTADKFSPDLLMTRSEATAIIVRALSVSASENASFNDVHSTDWFSSYVHTAKEYGIVSGVSASAFAPLEFLTREQAATMLARAAALCGMSTQLSQDAARDVLAQFEDYTSASAWSMSSLAFCCSQGIMDTSSMTLNPQAPVKRWELAQMLHRMLTKAKMIS